MLTVIHSLFMYVDTVPVDWFTLWLHMPFMVLYSDIRQGIFYSVLLCFWVIFAGEHMMVRFYLFVVLFKSGNAVFNAFCTR